MLDNRGDMALAVEEHTAVARGVVERGRNERRRRSGLRLHAMKAHQRFRGQERCIAVEQHQPTVAPGQFFTARSQCMTRSLLLPLAYEADSARLEQCFDFGGLMS